MKKRILVVDDDNMNLARTRIILGKEYDVVLADSGIQALAKVQNEKVDMVLLDIDMPVMNGIETFERMKKAAVAVPVGVGADKPASAAGGHSYRVQRLAGADYAVSIVGILDAAADDSRLFRCMVSTHRAAWVKHAV